jgi:ribulose-5-phosphate 4-epimerase/fuculose-1-phosphate aldolase
MTNDKQNLLVGQLIETARLAGSLNLVVSSSGNISVRLDDDTFAISSSGASMRDLDRASLSICRITDNVSFEGPGPSMETPLHREIYRCREDVNAVLHFQSPAATALACGENVDFNLNFIPEIPVYIKSVGIVPYFHPGSDDLAEGVASKAREGSNILILTNHGQVSLGKDLPAALRNAEFFELACQVACSGLRLMKFSDEAIETLRSFKRG